MLTKLAELSLRRARTMLTLAVIAVLAMAALGAGAFGKLVSGGFDDPSAPSSLVEKVIDKRFSGNSDLVFLVTTERSGGIDTPEAGERGRTLTSELRGAAHVSQVTSYWDGKNPALRGEDGKQALVVANVEGNDAERDERAGQLIDVLTGTADGVAVHAGGLSGVSYDVNGQLGKDLVLAEAIAVPVTLILLVLAFGSLTAALLPLVIGLIAIVGTFAELFVLGSVTDVSIFSINLTTALGLGLGVDYALLLVSRFREQLAGGAEVHDALRRTVQTAGRTIVFAATTVAVALATLLIFPPFFLRSFAFAGVGVVVIAALSALLVIPPLLVVLGHRIDKVRLPWLTSVPQADAPFWGKLAAVVMRRPALTALPVLAVLLLAASPLLGVSFGTPDERVLPEDADSRQVAVQLKEDFPAVDTGVMQVVTEDDVAGEPLRAYALELSGLDGVTRVESGAATYRKGRVFPAGPNAQQLQRPGAQRLFVYSATENKSAKAQDLVRDVRGVDSPEGAEMLVGGQDARLVDSQHTIGDRLPLALGLVAVSTFLLLFLFTGSIVQPLRALLLNCVSLAASLGIMAWIFAEGNLSSWLGFTPQPLDTSMTVLLFCIVFGLSMDYEVFVTSRMKELKDAGADRLTIVTAGLSKTGRMVTVAAGLLSVSFFSFGTSQISFLQMFGLGCGIAILIDAVAVRGVLVPAAMRLLGGAAWYAPRGLRRLHARVGLTEGEEASPRPEPKGTPAEVREGV
jgi:putative drug exporter of the RND superfamily